MIEKFTIHTDLALEQKERFESDNVEVSGVVLEEEYDEEKEIRVTKVMIETENGAKVMGKPVGQYITLEAPGLSVADEGYHQGVAEKAGWYLRQLMDCKKDKKVLVVGLGNRKVAPDALGPYVIDKLKVTRHIMKEYGKYAVGDEKMMISAMEPGVMGKTGMETVEILRGIVKETKPDCIVAIDALAARNSKRLNRTIQIANTGIHPGSGIGNQRNVINKKTVGVPVYAIGVPTVVDAATIVNDALENLLELLETSETLRAVGTILQSYSGVEKYQLVQEVLSPNLNGMFVTPKDIDDTIQRTSGTIAKALNHVFSNAE